ncbi:MAG: hypothetical protein ACOY33_11535 [Pseudomonadota bacterium]
MTLAATLAAGAMLPNAAQADQISEEVFDESRPTAGAMFLDTFVARPFLIVGTVLGVGVTAVSLPFSVLGGNTGAVAKAWIGKPGKAAFFRCLGCTPAQHERMAADEELEDATSDASAAANAG